MNINLQLSLYSLWLKLTIWHGYWRKNKNKIHKLAKAFLPFHYLWPDAKQLQPKEICLICSVHLHLTKDNKCISMLYWHIHWHCNHQHEICTCIGICIHFHFQCSKTNTRTEICQSPCSGDTDLNINIYR